MYQYQRSVEVYSRPSILGGERSEKAVREVDSCCFVLFVWIPQSISLCWSLFHLLKLLLVSPLHPRTTYNHLQSVRHVHRVRSLVVSV
jgi:hypothetical protein